MTLLITFPQITQYMTVCGVLQAFRAIRKDTTRKDESFGKQYVVTNMARVHSMGFKLGSTSSPLWLQETKRTFTVYVTDYYEHNNVSSDLCSWLRSLGIIVHEDHNNLQVCIHQNELLHDQTSQLLLLPTSLCVCYR